MATRGLPEVAAAVRDAAWRMLPAELRGNEKAGGSTPYEVVLSRGPVRVLRYEACGETRHAVPIVFVYSLINRYYILDFMPGRSLLEYLTGQGHTCYVIDWGTPGIAERHKTWGDYVLGHIGAAVDCARGREGVEKVKLYGYCMGGTLALAYAALRPESVQAFAAMAVPVDFHDEGLLSKWTSSRFFNVDALVDAYGNVPTWLMESGFRMLTPMSNVSKWRDLWQNRDDEGFVGVWRALERWSSDNVAFPAEVYRQYIRDCYQKNVFCQNEMRIDGERVDLGRITAPVLLIQAKNDHIVPRPSSFALHGLVGSKDVEVLDLPTGHIGLSTSSKASKVFWPPIDAWLTKHDAP